MKTSGLRKFINSQEIKRGCNLLIPIDESASYTIPERITRSPLINSCIQVRSSGPVNDYQETIENESNSIVGIYTGIRDALYIYIALMPTILDISVYGLDAYKYDFILDNMCHALYGNSQYDIYAMSMKKKHWEKWHPEIKSCIIGHLPHRSIIVPTRWSGKVRKNFFKSAYECGWYSISSLGRLMKERLYVQKSKTYGHESHMDGLIVPIVQIPMDNPAIEVSKWEGFSTTMFIINLK